MHKKILFIAALLLIAAGVSAAERMSYGKRINLWEKRPPHKSDNPKDTAWVKVFLPEKSKATGRAIVICPGGGYQHLAMEHEGTDWAPVFNNMGIAAIVLHYRMPHGDPRIPIEDAEQAMREHSVQIVLRAIPEADMKAYMAAWNALAKDDPKRSDDRDLVYRSYRTVTDMDGEPIELSHDEFVGFYRSLSAGEASRVAAAAVRVNHETHDLPF